MSNFFACPQCGKEYPREKRLTGRAVVCECGHRFLVPAAPLPEAEIEAVPLEAEVVSMPLEAEIVSLPVVPVAAFDPSPYMPQVVLGSVPQAAPPPAPKKKAKPTKKKARDEAHDSGRSVMGRWGQGAAGLVIIIAIRAGIRLGCREVRDSLRTDEPRSSQQLRPGYGNPAPMQIRQPSR